MHHFAYAQPLLVQQQQKALPPGAIRQRAEENICIHYIFIYVYLDVYLNGSPSACQARFSGGLNAIGNLIFATPGLPETTGQVPACASSGCVSQRRPNRCNRPTHMIFEPEKFHRPAGRAIVANLPGFCTISSYSQDYS